MERRWWQNKISPREAVDGGVMGGGDGARLSVSLTAEKNDDFLTSKYYSEVLNFNRLI